ncbi:LAME_0C06546g1_1 [Lachancea meyersii CBS 8951]|uniref:LAME_0C06546g1_1 n=1 Tax=Lachancea meyersii CBS 8951 TaxID=1266667 RepID=A0A1G4J287_9SACH|nr:LAME_0C06546g1_1 [Lachancea meyersii CBS 8951]
MAFWDHIAYQAENVDYYIPILFGYSATFEQIVPCFVGDIERGYARWEKDIKRYYPSGSSFWLLGNHPMHRLTVQGSVVSWKWKFIGDSDHAFFKIDDCTRASPDIVSLLNCKCSRSLILRDGLPNADLSGWRLTLHGVINQYQELEVQSIEICASISQEVEFWRTAMAWRDTLQEPWALDKKALKLALAQEEGLASHTDYTFVQRLERQAYQSQMQISNENGPVEAVEEILLPLDFDSLDLVLDDGYDLVQRPAGNQWTSGDGSGEAIPIGTLSEDCTSVDMQIVSESAVKLRKYSINDYRRLLLEYFICQRAPEISTLNTFRNPTLIRVLRSLVHAESPDLFEKEASSIFAQVLTKLVDLGLIRVFAQGRILGLKVLQACYAQAARRVTALVALRLNTGTLDFRAQCYAVQLPYQKALNAIVLDLYKRALRRVTEDPFTDVQSWWLEMTGPSTALVHFLRT